VITDEIPKYAKKMNSNEKIMANGIALCGFLASYGIRHALD
jgi:hypothetical protein